MNRIAVIGAGLGALGVASSGAIAKPAISFSADHSVAFAAPRADTKLMPYLKKAQSATIYSNLAAKYSKGLYWSDEGDSIYDSGGSSQFCAGGFTPAANATAMSVQVAVGNFEDELPNYTVSINADNAGVPGAVLWSGPITSTTAFGTCCGVETASIKGGLALTAGTPYWVAVTLNKKQQKAGDDGAWNLATVDQVDPAPFAYNANNAGWKSYQTTTPPAFGVFSQ